MEEFIRPVFLLIGIFVLARASTFLAKRFGLPSISILLLIGILLGPSVLNLLGRPIILGTWGSPSPGPLHTALKILAEIGLIQLMFLAGLQMDWQTLKTMLKPIFAMSGLILVFMAVSFGMIIRGFVDRWSEALAISAIMAASGIGVSTYNFRELNFLGSRLSNIVTGAAMMGGGLAILLMITSLAANYAMAYGGFKAFIAVSWFLGKLIMFFAISYFLLSRFLNRLGKTAFEKRPRQTLIGYLLLMAALYAWGAMHFGSFAAVGIASLGGALLGISNLGLKENIRNGLGSVLASLPMGLLFVALGMEVDFKEVQGSINTLLVLFVTVVGVKGIGGWIAVHRNPDLFSERAVVILGALNQGEIGMLIAAYLFSRGIINPSQFNITVIVVVILTMITPVLMKIASYSPSPFDGRKLHRVSLVERQG